MPSLEVLLFRLFLVVIVSGCIGAEREYRSKSAGFRTMILICLGAFLFTTFGTYISGSTSDRIASNIVTGIGFIGAGVIFQTDNKVNGLTTAATIWAVAALGMGIAGGFYSTVIISTVIIFTSLFFFTKLEDWIDQVNQSRHYKIVSNYNEELLYHFEDLFKKYKLRFTRLKQSKVGDQVSGTWLVLGRSKDHNQLIKEILRDTSVSEFEF